MSSSTPYTAFDDLSQEKRQAPLPPPPLPPCITDAASNAASAAAATVPLPVSAASSVASAGSACSSTDEPLIRRPQHFPPQQEIHDDDDEQQEQQQQEQQGSPRRHEDPNETRRRIRPPQNQHSPRNDDDDDGLLVGPPSSPRELRQQQQQEQPHDHDCETGTQPDFSWPTTMMIASHDTNEMAHDPETTTSTTRPCHDLNVSPAQSISEQTPDSLPQLESTENASVTSFAGTNSTASLSDDNDSPHPNNNKQNTPGKDPTKDPYQGLRLLRHPSLNHSRSMMGGMEYVPLRIHKDCMNWACPHGIILPRYVRNTKVQKAVALVCLLVFLSVGLLSRPSARSATTKKVRVAMIGNSMMYYNDFPRFLEAISDGHIKQDSCLHGDATMHSILITGSGTYKVWRTGVAQIRNASVELYGMRGSTDDDGGDVYEDDGLNDRDYEYNYNVDQEEQDGNSNHYKYFDFTKLFDYGACTVPQLLFGFDKTLDNKMQDWSFDKSYESHGDDYFDDDDYYTLGNDDEVYGYNFENFFDGTNPCLMDPNYYQYKQYLFWGGEKQNRVNDPYYGNDDYYSYYSNGDEDRHNLYPTAPKWHYVIINDNTRSAAQAHSRKDALSILENQYLLWFQETGSVPILMMTYAYDTPYRDMTGMIDIPTFTSLTYEGYRQYAELLSQRLPENQQPRIAPVGLAFLTVWEEAYDFWNTKLFHVDRIHASPHGTYLQGCVVYCTIYGKLPPRKTAILKLESLWNDARRMGPVKHRRLPLPTREEALYLYHIAERVCLHNHVPKAFIYYENGESTNYIPEDDTYKNNDFY